MPLPRDAASVFDRKNTPLMRLVDATDPQALEGASPCEGWSGVDVLQHLIDTGDYQRILAQWGVETGLVEQAMINEKEPDA